MKCRVAVFLIIGWGVLSLIGYLKKDGIYKNYSIDVKKTPYFVLVLDGIHDKIYPWSKELPDLYPALLFPSALPRFPHPSFLYLQ